jgi:hypothetical protein
MAGLSSRDAVYEEIQGRQHAAAKQQKQQLTRVWPAEIIYFRLRGWLYHVKTKPRVDDIGEPKKPAAASNSTWKRRISHPNSISRRRGRGLGRVCSSSLSESSSRRS